MHRSLTKGLVFATISVSLLAEVVGQESVVPPAKVNVAAGFKVTEIYRVPREQGSWVSLTAADRGRLVACSQNGKLYRITTGAKAEVEALTTSVGRAQGLLYAFDSLYVMGKDGRRQGLFRLTDTNGDDQFDKVEHLISVRVGGEHHAHAIILSPDRKSLYICAGNMANIPKRGFTSWRMPLHQAGDHLVPRMPDARGHNTGAKPLGGWVARISSDGKQRELIANGFRNEYDIAFNPAGELFTFDSDMEYDIGAAWYRPTRVCHVVSGAEFGWRFGSGKWPAYFADSLSSVIDIGPGSPTGIVFGTGAAFPARYQKALFIADWSYGVIYAVHLAPRGASYTATKEVFATAAPFPVTDMVVHPDDGSLYFAVGGRGARSSLYRVEYTGSESTAGVVATDDAGTELRRLRHRLEALHVRDAPKAVDTAWKFLGHADRHIRFAARIAVENQSGLEWQERVIAEQDPRTLIHGVIALARHSAPALRQDLLNKLVAVPWAEFASDEKLELLRAYGLVLVRLGDGTDGIESTTRAAVIKALSAVFPDKHRHVSQELCRVLSHLNAPAVVATSLQLLADAPAQEEQMHYAYCLRTVTKGWTPTLRKQYLAWFAKAAGYRGGASFWGFCKNIRKDFIARMPAAERIALGDLVTKVPKPSKSATPIEARAFVKSWTVAELTPLLEKKTSGHDYARGRRLFGAASCFRCHRFAGEGGAVGPDLTALGGRFGIREILESIIAPSAVISDQYQPTIFELKNGDVVVGYVANYNRGQVKVAEDMFRPGDFTSVKVDQIVSQEPSPVSMMPPGLISTLSAAEIRDLVAYMRSGGKPDHALFK